MTHLFIFNNASRAANYGIGSYVKQLADGLKGLPDTKLSMVEMYADTKEFAVTDDEHGVKNYLIPPFKGQAESETYCRGIFYFLARNIGVGKHDRVVFQFNYFQHYPLAMLLKAWLPQCRIVLAVHYLAWCFELHGNVQCMRKITARGYVPCDDAEKNVRLSFEQEKRFLNLADAVFVLSGNTLKILEKDYEVLPDKMHLIYNGAGNEVCESKNRTGNNVRHLLFVGRLDEIKGLKYLIDAFTRIASKHPGTQLKIAGDGDFQPYLAQSRTLAGSVTFLGRMQKDEVEKVYRQNCIGVMPSFHEQCSYTAIEMMRHGIPIVGTDSTGLGEMLDATPELRIHIDEENFNEDTFVQQIATQTDRLLTDDTAYAQASAAVVRLYKERYTVTAMMQGVQKALHEVTDTADGHVATDYLPHIDEQMMHLINRKPDIDADFYGLGGIGAYLWWRVLQLETGEADNAKRLALIKEHLIYYIDWIEEVAQEEPLPAVLRETLADMKRHKFYPTKVTHILQSSHISDEGDTVPSAQAILQNALKICTSKI